MNNLYPAIVAAVFGRCFGSFTTMLVWRLHYDEKGIFAGRSKCPKCKKTLSPISLVPIFSWIFQRGKCLNCGKKISVFYPLVEITFAIVFSLFTYKFFRGNLIDFSFLMTSIFLILVLFFYDLKFLEVDRRISFPSIIIAIVWAFFRGNWEIYLIGGTIGFLFYFIQFWGTKILLKRQGVGIGDFELGALMGLLLGWKLFLPAIFFSYILGTFIALPLLLFQKKLAIKLPRISGHLALPMGAFLMPALLLFLYNGQVLLDWYWQILI